MLQKAQRVQTKPKENSTMGTGRTVLGTVGSIALVVLVGPWVLLYILFSVEDMRKEWAAKAEAKAPTSLVAAVCGPYATPDAVAALVRGGADVHQVLHLDASTPPMPLVAWAASCGHVDIVQWLLAHGARRDDIEWRAVLVEEQDAMAHFLLAQGLPLDRVDPARSAPDAGIDLLQAAAHGGQGWLVPKLVAAGHDPQSVTKSGVGLVALAAQSESIARVNTGLNPFPATVDALIHAGAHKDPLTADEVPAVYEAVHAFGTQTLDRLLAAGVNVDAAVPRAHLEANAATQVHVTALSRAVEDCRLDAAEHLLEHGAARTATDPFGKALADAACARNDYPPYPLRAKMKALLAR
jgi:hypothetical protein